MSGAAADVVLVGSHGSEFNADFLDAVDESAKSLLADIERAMAGVAAQFPGAGVETKPVSVAFHVRNVAPQDAQRALDAALAAVADWDVHITEGKAVRSSPSSTPTRVRPWMYCAARPGPPRRSTSATMSPTRRPSPDWGGRDVGVKVGSGDTRAAYRVDTPRTSRRPCGSCTTSEAAGRVPRRAGPRCAREPVRCRARRSPARRRGQVTEQPSGPLALLQARLRHRRQPRPSASGIPSKPVTVI